MLPQAASYLLPDVSFTELDRVARAQTDHAAARPLQESRLPPFAELRAVA